ncbi:DUF2271 domain-containing protein [uncultured Treponema sp.]|uniref:DUF2271 domain-containing protein n=1 Tax=uncultured Treponema sp. TaxID=162155 RepID=UPI0025E56B69|nr:DUF2271 domain-containing protein [uncultured Treponema sp.]
MNLKSSMKKIFIASFALMIFQQVWAKETSENMGTAQISAVVTLGSEWKGKFPPQFALWIQDENGKFCQTIFATKKASKKKWIFAPKDGRPESLPVWYHSCKNFYVSESENELDAVTSATPKGSFEISRKIQLEEGKKYFVYAEVNKSFDYNEFYPKDAEKNASEYSGVNGQPSAVYRAEFGFKNLEAKLELVGTGSLDGKSGSVEYKTETLTTAKNLVEKIIVCLEFPGDEK